MFIFYAGNGWLKILIGAVVITENFECACNSKVNIFLNGTKVYQTVTRPNEKAWVGFDSTYYSKKISKDTQVQFDVLSDDTSIFGTQNQNRSITDILGKSFFTHNVKNEKVYLLFSAIWRDEYDHDEL